MTHWTRKPCEGCGREGKRVAGKVCVTCQQHLRLGQEEDARREAARDRGDGELVRVDVAVSENADPLYVALLEFIRACGERVSFGFDYKVPFIGYGYDPGGASTDTYRMTSNRIELALAVMRAYRDMRNGRRAEVEASYEAGLAKGQSFLIRLAEGDVTIRDYEREERLGRGRRVQ